MEHFVNSLPTSVMRAIGYFLLVVFAIGVLVFTTGCNTEVKGGQANHETGTIASTAPTTQQADKDFYLELPTPYGVLKYRKGDTALSTQGTATSHEFDNISTEQASGKTNTGQNLSIGSAKEGVLGSLSFISQQIPYKNAWMLALGFAALAAAAWFLFKDLMLTLIFAACAVLSFLSPAVMIWVGILVGVFAAWKVYNRTSKEKAVLQGQFSEVVAGAKRALGVLPPELKDRAKAEMEAEQNDPTKLAVAVAKIKK